MTCSDRVQAPIIVFFLSNYEKAPILVFSHGVFLVFRLCYRKERQYGGRYVNQECMIDYMAHV